MSDRYVLALRLPTVNLQRAKRVHTFSSVRFDFTDPLDVARAIFGAALGVTTLVLLVLFVTTGDWNWRLLGMVFALWTFWGIFHDVTDRVLRPLGGWLLSLLAGGGSGAPITIEEETAYLERLLERRLPPHNEILSGIRLAEIYRTHQRSPTKADAVIVRLLAKYPDAPELKFVRRLTPPA